MKSTEKTKLRRRCILWGLSSFGALVSPLTAVLIANRERYVTSVQDAVQLSAGGLICAVFLLLLTFGKIKAPGPLFGTALVFVLSFLLEPVLRDLLLLSGAALTGQVADWIFFAPQLRRTQEKLRMQEQAAATADLLEGALQRQYTGRV